MIKDYEYKIIEFVKKILKKLNIEYSNKTENLFIQIFKFVIVGGIATIIDWILYFIIYNFLKINPLISNLISFSISSIYNYTASIKWVFDVNANKSKKRLFVEFMIFSFIGLGITETLLWIGTQQLGMNAMLVKIMSTIIVMIFNFITRKMFLE